MMRPAFFFDRDGTLNEDLGYIHRWDQFRWCLGAVTGIRELNAAGILVVVVTNQGGVAHGFYTETDVAALHARMNADLARRNARIDAFYHCPHHPKGKVVGYSIDCPCRKPRPGLLLKAIADLGIDPAESVMVGDRESDLQAAVAAGIASIKIVGKNDDRGALVSHLVRTRLSGSPRSPLQPAT